MKAFNYIWNMTIRLIFKQPFAPEAKHVLVQVYLWGKVVVAIDTETVVGVGTCLGIDVARYKCLYRSLNNGCLKGPLYAFL